MDQHFDGPDGRLAAPVIKTIFDNLVGVQCDGRINQDES
jgi:hypothetical protein